jgi:parallel beta-helix repeat protein
MGASCQVRYNNVTHNGKGVIVYAMDGLRLSENNMSDNEEYAVSLMEGQTRDVDAGRNWWGTKDKNKIEGLIWDKNEENTLGEVNYSGFLDSRVKGAGVPW